MAKLNTRHNMRLTGFGALEDAGVDLAPQDNNEDEAPETSWEGKPLLRVEHDDGSITISLDGKPVYEDDEAERAQEWFANLVDDIDQMELSRIANDLLRGIEDDLESRRDWMEDRAHGIRLLGLKIDSGTPSLADGAPIEGMSKVRHPLLLEAVLRFQANARSELLPTDGPVKVRVDMNGSTIEMDELANDLEADLNHYLTDTAAEYYPDTDRMLFMLGFGGTAFKKIYFCPLRGRPISESVDSNDLIVNNMALTLEDARRVTHRVMMRPSTVKRLQILGVYRDIDLNTPMPTDPDAVQQEKASQQGLSPDASNPDDRDREIYECYCELDIVGYEHKHKGKITGLEIPYRVTIDVSSREILSIVRNYDEPETSKDLQARKGSNGSYDVLPRARKNFVKYSFVPGMGFYDIGLLHILGNTTNAVTAMWREMIDAGMFANFPGFLISDNGARQQTNIFRVPPGGAAVVKTGGVPINQAVMPLPYKEPGGAMFNLVQNMVETGQRLGGTAEQAVGEGKQDAPVGTTLALIDQQTKVLNSVHKRMHRSQADEFRLLVRTFREHPDSFLAGKSGYNKQWTEHQFVEALNKYELVPQADPNTASQMQRQMKIIALKELQSQNPSLYDPVAIDLAALKAMGWSNPEQFLVPEEKRSQMPPEMMNQLAVLKIQKQEADARMLDAQTKAAVGKSTVAKNMADSQAGPDGQPQVDPNQMAELQVKQQELQHKQEELTFKAQSQKSDLSIKMAELQSKDSEAQSKLDASLVDATNRMRDRESAERLSAVQLAEKISTANVPNAAKTANQYLPKDMMNRLNSQENPIPGTSPAYGKDTE